MEVPVGHIIVIGPTYSGKTETIKSLTNIHMRKVENQRTRK